MRLAELVVVVFGAVVILLLALIAWLLLQLVKRQFGKNKNGQGL